VSRRMAGRSRVTRREETLATVDTRSFEVTYPAASSGSASESVEDGGSGFPWILIGAGAAALAAVLVLVRRRAAPAA